MSDKDMLDIVGLWDLGGHQWVLQHSFIKRPIPHRSFHLSAFPGSSPQCPSAWLPAVTLFLCHRLSSPNSWSWYGAGGIEAAVAPLPSPTSTHFRDKPSMIQLSDSYLRFLVYSQGPVPVRGPSVLLGINLIIHSTHFIELLLDASPLKAKSPLFFQRKYLFVFM